MTKLFQHIAETLNECWHVAEEQMEDWTDEMVQKFKYMIMHVQNSRTKDKPPAWLLELDLPQWEKNVGRHTRKEIPQLQEKAQRRRKRRAQVPVGNWLQRRRGSRMASTEA